MSPTTDYIVHLTTTLPSFRIPELRSLASSLQLAPSDLIFLPDEPAADDRLTIIRLPTYFSTAIKLPPSLRPSVSGVELTQEHGPARALFDRSFSIHHAYIYLAGPVPSYELLFEQMRQSEACRERLQTLTDKTWRFSFDILNRTLSRRSMTSVINRFSWMDIKGPVDMQKYDVDYCIVLKYEERNNADVENKGVAPAALESDPKQIMFGIHLSSGARALVPEFSLKTRAFIGNTSLGAEEAFFMANQALAKPGMLIYDPFAGTGSILLSCAKMGAHVFASDIDGRQMGSKKAREEGLYSSFKQYNLQHLWLDNLTADVTHLPWNRKNFLDAYGHHQMLIVDH